MNNSACGDGDEVVVSFNRSSLLFESCFKWLLHLLVPVLGWKVLYIMVFILDVQTFNHLTMVLILTLCIVETS